jgi:hypothetical protein
MEQQHIEEGLIGILRLFHDDINLTKIELIIAYKYIFENSTILPFFDNTELTETVVYIRDERDANKLSDIIELENHFKRKQESYVSFIDDRMTEIELEEAESEDIRLSSEICIIDNLFYDHEEEKWKLMVNDIIHKILERGHTTEKAILKPFDDDKRSLLYNILYTNEISSGYANVVRTTLWKSIHMTNIESMNGKLVAYKQSNIKYSSYLTESDYNYKCQRFHWSHKRIERDICLFSKPKQGLKLGKLVTKTTLNKAYSCRISLNFSDKKNVYLKLHDELKVMNDCIYVSEKKHFSSKRNPFYREEEFVKSLTENVKRKKVVISYSKKDIEHAQILTRHLQPLVDEGLIDRPWFHRPIKWNLRIQERHDEADIVFFIVSPNSYSTKSLFRKEVKNAIDRYDNREMIKIIPIIIDYCSWEHKYPYNLKRFTSLPYQDKSINNFQNHSLAWDSIISSVRMMINAYSAPGGSELTNNELDSIEWELCEHEIL